MNIKELYLKTIFCCIACDGDIAKEEIVLVQKMVSEDEMFDGVDVKSLLDRWIAEINENGTSFLRTYLSELADSNLTEQEQLTITDLAIKAIEADNSIKYSEVKFFKKIRVRLTVSDDAILKQHPDKEDFLLPDISVAEDPVWDENTKFFKISLKKEENNDRPCFWIRK